jgi:hypothetical protein
MARHPVIGLVAAIAILLHAGCIRHVARVTPAAEAADAEHPHHLVVGSTTAPVDGPTTLTSPLPIDAPFTAWKRAESGELFRCDGRVRTPLRWWQRFPMDAVSDFLPIDLEASARADVTYRSVPVRDEADLTQHAQRDGFAHAHAAHP